jgi:hypothetical protein
MSHPFPLFGHAAAVGVYVHVAVALPLRSLIVPEVACVDTNFCSTRSNISAAAAHSARRVSPSVFEVVTVTVSRVGIFNLL